MDMTKVTRLEGNINNNLWLKLCIFDNTYEK